MELTTKGKGICTIFGSLLIEFIFGSLYTWPSINTYYMSYLRENGNPSIKLVDGFFLMPLVLTIAMICGIVGTKLELIIGMKKCVFISLILIFTSHLIILNSVNIYITYIAMSIFGIGNGISMLNVLKNCWLFFPDQKGFISGVILFGLGSSASLFTIIADIVINPLHIKVDVHTGFFAKEISTNTRSFILILTIIIVVTSIVSFCFIYDYASLPKEPKSSIETKEVNNDVHLISNINKLKEEKEIKSPIKQAFRDLKIWQLALINFCALYPCSLCMNTYRTFGQLYQMDESLLSLLSKTSPLINGVSRIIWGLLSDRLPFKYLYSFLLLLTITFSVSFYHIATYPWFYFASVCIIAFVFSGNICVLVPLFPKIYGLKYSAQIYAIAIALSGFNTILSPIIAKIIVKEKQDYKLLYFTGTFFAVIGLFVCIVFKDAKFKYKDEGEDIEQQELTNKN